MGSWLWVLLTPLCTPTKITVIMRTIEGISMTAWKGASAFLTAISPIYVHAYQSLCPVGRPFDFPHQRFRLPFVKAKYRISLNIRTTTREKGNDFQGWTVHTGGRTCVSEGETTAGWGVVARSPDGKLFITFGVVFTTETHLT